MSTLLALALGALQTEAKAEEAFRRIEERLARAKTLSLKYSSETGSPAIHRMKGSFHLGEGGKLNWDARLSSPHASFDWPLRAVSDGPRIQVKFPTVQRLTLGRPEESWRSREVMDRETPPGFRERMLRLLLVFGLSGPALPRRDEQFWMDARNEPLWHSSPYDLPWSRVEARELRGPGREGEWETLSFKIKVEGLEPLYEAKLVYEPATSRLVRRELFLTPLPSLVLTERYETWEWDRGLPPETFAPLRPSD